MRPLILVDIDGTLALRGDRDPHAHEESMEDAVNYPIAYLCDRLQVWARIVLISGREEIHRAVTEYWLYVHRLVPYREGLVMRPTGDNRPDDVVKQELYEQVIVPKWGPASYVLDDRNKVVAMWRSLGLTCLQVADGDF